MAELPLGPKMFPPWLPKGEVSATSEKSHLVKVPVAKVPSYQIFIE